MPAEHRASAAGVAVGDGGRARSLGAATAVMVVGLALVLAAVAAARQAVDREPGAEQVAVERAQPPAAADPVGLLLRGPGDVSVVTSVYEAGQSSGWHVHRGLHAVAVLSGELTVYDRDCRPQRVGPGEPYVGGQELHLARNETSAPVDMVVTYLNGAGASPASQAREAPAGCGVL